MQTCVTTESPQQTRQLAALVGTYMPAGTVLAAQGGLGVGKTLFAQGLAKGLGCTEEVTSPTFIYFEEYQGRMPFCHIDAYRLEHFAEEELALIGLEECFLPHKTAYVEWPQFVTPFLPADTILLQFTQTAEAPQRRELCFTYQQPQQAWLAQALTAFAANA